MKQRSKALVIILPVLVMLGWVLMQERAVVTGTHVRLKIMGFDPRDLLSGHFLQFRIDYQNASVCPDNKYEASQCVCLESPGGVVPARATWVGKCNERPACALWLKGSCDWRGFDAGIDRFYFPEEYSKQLVTVPPNSSVEVSIDGAGHGVIMNLFVEGQPLLDYLRKPRIQQ